MVDNIYEPAQVFISCGQKTAEERQIAQNISDMLKNKAEGFGFRPYVAIRQQASRGFKEEIYENLEKSDYYIFIDFKREKIVDDLNEELVDHSRKDVSEEYRGSLFSHQEYAISAYLNKDMIILQEKGIKKRDGLLGVIQSNPKEFTDRENLHLLVQDMVKQRKWDPNSKKEIVLDVDKDYPYADAIIEAINPPRWLNIAPARWFHVKVTNAHKKKEALDCVGYITAILEKDTKEEKYFNKKDHDKQIKPNQREPVELKWKGINVVSSTIFPGKYKFLDAFQVYRDVKNPDKIDDENVGYFGINFFIVDHTDYYKQYKLGKNVDLEVSYIVYSRNFPPSEAKFSLHIGDKINDIKFEKIQ